MSNTQSKPVSIKIITGSTRENRFSHKAATWIASLINEKENVDCEIIDLADYDMPFFNAPVSPAFKQEPYKNKAVARFTKKIDQADGFILVTPEYNHGTSGVLKNALDWVYQEWHRKAVGFVSYGSVGGARAVEQLRLNAVELHMAPVRDAVHMLGNDYFPVVMGQTKEADLFAKYTDPAKVMIEQLLWWTKALREAR